MEIPIANLYYILCYAWDELKQGDFPEVSADKAYFPPNLLAELLASQIERLNKKGLQSDYVNCREETRWLRGKIEMGRTLSRALLKRGRLACNFDEYTPNTIPNRIVKTTAQWVLRDNRIDPELGHRLRVALSKWAQVESIELEARTFVSAVIQRKNYDYKFLMNLCEFIFQIMLPDQSNGGIRFKEFVRDEVLMRRVFEKFIRNFYRIEQRRYVVRAERMPWFGKALTEGAESFLPTLNTDISLASEDRRIIIDVKYYKEGATRLGLYENIRLHPDHLFQLMSYLKNVEARDGVNPEGFLVYPMVADNPRHLEFELLGLKIGVHSLDLGKSWREIRDDLLTLIAA